MLSFTYDLFLVCQCLFLAQHVLFVLQLLDQAFNLANNIKVQAHVGGQHHLLDRIAHPCHLFVGKAVQ